MDAIFNSFWDKDSIISAAREMSIDKHLIRENGKPIGLRGTPSLFLLFYLGVRGVTPWIFVCTWSNAFIYIVISFCSFVVFLKFLHD